VCACMHFLAKPSSHASVSKKDKKKNGKKRDREKKEKYRTHRVVSRHHCIHSHTNVRNTSYILLLLLFNMSDKAQGEGHWESQSYSSQTTKIGDNPSVTVGKEASAQGTFDVRNVFFLTTFFFIVHFSMVNH
jgi:hypothetical protein